MARQAKQLDIDSLIKGPRPIFKLYKPASGHPDWNEIFRDAEGQAKQIAQVINLDRHTFSERLDLERRRFAGYMTAARNFQINRKRLKAHNHALRPIYYIWTMLNACNFRCTYCDDHMGRSYFELPDKGRLTTEHGKKLLKVMRTGTSAIYFCGGEPTMRADLPELLNEANRLNYFPCIINTNGSLFHENLLKPAWKNFLRQMDIIIVSVDGLNTALMDKIYEVDQCRQVLTNVITLLKLSKLVKFKLVVNTVIMPETLAEAGAVLDWANDLGIWFVPVPVNEAAHAERKLFTNPKYLELARTIVERKKQGYKLIGSEKLLEMLVFGKPYQCFTTLKPHIDFDGHIIWPCKATTNIKPVRVNVLDYDTVDQLYDAASRLVNPNDYHGSGPNQCGGNCNWMQNYTTEIYMQGLMHPLTSGFIKEIREFTGTI
jgi:MoaA/NifB/PqqE/SkfB family radical SAM enzyme